MKIAAHVLIKINNQQVLATLDTGADVSIIPASLVKGMPLKPTTVRLIAANNTEIAVEGRLSLTVYIDDQPVTLHGVVSHQVTEVLLGKIFMTLNDVTPHLKLGIATINGHKTQLFLRPAKSWDQRIIVANRVTVPARSEAIIPAHIQFNGEIIAKKATLMTHNSLPMDGLCVARSILPDRSVDLPIRLVNSSGRAIHLLPGFPLAEVEPVEIMPAARDEVANAHTVGAEALPSTSSANSLMYTPDASGQLLQQQQQQHLTDISHQLQQLQQQQDGTSIGSSPTETDTKQVDEIIDKLVNSVDPSVSEFHKSQLRALFEKYRSVFSISDFDIGLIPGVEHAIDTGNAPPFRERLRRHPPQHEAIIETQIQELLKKGFIIPSASPYCSNLVLAKKHDGSYRICVDHRRLNSQTKVDAYLPALAQDCVDALSGAKWLTALDLRMAYHTVKIRSSDVPKTQFICKSGTYSWTRMTFGLCNAPASWARAIDIVLSGLTPDICVAYLDDIVCFSRTIEEHLDRLEHILHRLATHNLKFKPSKCQFLQKSISFLGFRISEQGLSTCPEKTR